MTRRFMILITLCGITSEVYADTIDRYGGGSCTEFDFPSQNCNSTHGILEKLCRHGSNTKCTFSSCNSPYVYDNGKCTCANSTGWQKFYGGTSYDYIQQIGTVEAICRYGDSAYVKFSSCNSGRTLTSSGHCYCSSEYDIFYHYSGSLSGVSYTQCDDGLRYRPNQIDGYAQYKAKITNFNRTITSTATYAGYTVSNLFCNNACSQKGLPPAAAIKFCAANGWRLPNKYEATTLLNDSSFRSYYASQDTGDTTFKLLLTTTIGKSSSDNGMPLYEYKALYHYSGSIKEQSYYWDGWSMYSFVCIKGGDVIGHY